VLHEAESSAAQYVTQEVFNHHYERAEEQYNTIRNLLRPYLGVRTSTDKVASMITSWENEFGSMDDPEVKASIDEFVRKTAEEIKESQDVRDERPRPKRANVTRWT